VSHYNMVKKGEFSMTDFSARVCRVVGYLFLGKSKCDIPTGLSRGRTACIFIFLVVTVSFVL